MLLIFKTALPDGQEARLYGKDDGDLEIYIDGAWGFTFTNGICKINTYTISHLTDDNIERREVAARLVMSLPTFYTFAQYFKDQLEVLEQRGVKIMVAPTEAKEDQGDKSGD